MMLKLGDKVAHKEGGLEGVLVYSSSGASVAGEYFDEDLQRTVRFQTLGYPLHTYEENWIKVEEQR